MFGTLPSMADNAGFLATIHSSLLSYSQNLTFVQVGNMLN